MIGFGVGNVFWTPPGSTPTSILMGQVQEASLDISFETKSAYGNSQFPFAIARGKGSMKGKAKAGIFQPQLVGSILTGATSAVGQRLLKLNESTGTISGATYTAATVTGFDDRGVKDDTSLALTRVASAPTATQYSVVEATGVYTFNSAANGKVFTISYTYTVSTAGTYTTTFTNQLMGSGSTYIFDLYNTNPDGSTFGLLLYAVMIEKLALAFKNEDFTMPDMDFQAFADASGNVLQYYGSAQ